MPKKTKFKPRITRIKLNPEQAVLMCECYLVGKKYVGPGSNYDQGCKPNAVYDRWIEAANIVTALDTVSS